MSDNQTVRSFINVTLTDQASTLLLILCFEIQKFMELENYDENLPVQGDIQIRFENVVSLIKSA